MTETRFALIEQRLDRGNSRLDALDRGQLHIINTMKEQDEERRLMREEMKKNTDATITVIGLAENMQAAGRFFNAIFNGVSWLVHKVSACAKLLAPIITVLLLLWGAWYAVTHGGKPPSVGDASPIPEAVAGTVDP